MKDKLIKSNSTGIQADGNISITQNNSIPKSLENMIVDLLKPSIQDLGYQLKNSLGKELSESIGSKIKKSLESEVLSSVKEQVKIKNLTYHINAVKQILEKEGGERPKQSRNIEESILRIDLFSEWAQGAEDVPPEDKLLANIWAGWLAALSKGDEIPENKIFLEKMKKINHADAQLLLRFDKRYSSQSEKELFILKKLSDLDLIERNYTTELTSVIVFIGALLCLIFVELFYPIKIILALLIIILFIAVNKKRFDAPSYKLSWAGKGIVSYARFAMKGGRFKNQEAEQGFFSGAQKAAPAKKQRYAQ